MLNPLSFISKFIKSSNKRELERIGKIVDKVNLLEDSLVNLPDADLNKTIVKNSTFIKEMRQYIHKERMEYSSTKEYLAWLKTNFKK